LLLPTLAGLLVERAIYKMNSFQFTRSARLALAHLRSARYAHRIATSTQPLRYSLAATLFRCLQNGKEDA